jgi:hypothetical protein
MNDRKLAYIEPPDSRQTEILRRMTGEQRLIKALDMCRVVWMIAADGVRAQYPGISEVELKVRLKMRHPC